MSHQPYPAPLASPPVQHTVQNGWGLTGLIVSVVGLALCGIPSIIGVVVSAIGLKKQPQSLAVAGLIVGLIGLVELVVFILVISAVYQFGVVTGRVMNAVQTQVVLQQKAAEIGEHWKTEGQIPDQATGDLLVNGTLDAFKNQILFETDGSAFTLRSEGKDGLKNTEDDVVAGPFKSFEATENLKLELDEGDFDFQNFDFDEFEQELKQQPKSDDKRLPPADEPASAPPGAEQDG